MSLPQRFFIVGAGRHAQVVLAAWQAGCCSEYDFHCFLGKAGVDTAEILQGHAIRWESPEALADLKRDGVTHFALGVGSVKASPERWELFQFYVSQGFEPLTLIHPSAYVAEQAELAEGVFVSARAVIQPFANIGQAAIINTGAVIEHHCEIARNVHVAPGAIVCGQVTIGENSMIGAGTTIIQSITVGSNTTVGAGSVVTRDVDSELTVVGCRSEVPAQSAQR